MKMEIMIASIALQIIRNIKYFSENLDKMEKLLKNIIAKTGRDQTSNCTDLLQLKKLKP